MAVTLTDLAYTKTYNDGEILDEADLDSALTSIQTYTNDTIKDNLVQLGKDSFGASLYTFNNDGVAVRTATLYNKQYGETTYVAGDIDLGIVTAGAFSSVDAVNAALSFTPEVQGQYRVTFTFTHTFQLSATSEGTCEVIFRFTDGTTASAVSRSGGMFPATAANAIRMATPITITKVFDWSDALAKTITLQKRVMAATNVATNVVSAGATSGEILMTVEKI